MKRFHVHVSVGNLQENIRFYSSILGAQPSLVKEDYAKWMLDDPRINFAISTRDGKRGLNHLGIQAESDAELNALRVGIVEAQAPILEQKEASCCYARSEKYWPLDPQSIAGETFHTLGSVPVYGEDTRTAQEPRVSTKAGACCVPNLG